MGSGLGSPMLAGLSVIITTKQLQFWGWTQLSPDFLAFYVSPMTQTDGRKAWVWGGGGSIIAVMSRGPPDIGCPPWEPRCCPLWWVPTCQEHSRCSKGMFI